MDKIDEVMVNQRSQFLSPSRLSLVFFLVGIYGGVTLGVSPESTDNPAHSIPGPYQ